MSDKNVIYIIGDDPIARSKELTKAIDDLLGDEDKSLALENYDLSDASGEDDRIQLLETIVQSLQSPPFLTSKRVVVVRDIGAASSEALESLIAYMEDVSPTSFLVALQGGGRISTKLTKAWKPHVEQRGVARQSPDEVLVVVTKENKMSFEPGVREAILSHCGEDNAKIASLIERLASVYGAGQKLSLEDVSDYLGESGNVAIYELANQICTGEVAKSLDIINRMMRTVASDTGKVMHPLQIIALLANHFRKLATLDDSSIRNQNDAHAALGGKGNPYGAKKSWELSRRLGSKKILSCLELLGSVDIAIKGATAIEPEIAIELAIISLCQICDGDNSSEKVAKSFSSNFALI